MMKMMMMTINNKKMFQKGVQGSSTGCSINIFKKVSQTKIFFINGSSKDVQFFG